jgi:hypothetical protein
MRFSLKWHQFSPPHFILFFFANSMDKNRVQITVIQLLKSKLPISIHNHVTECLYFQIKLQVEKNMEVSETVQQNFSNLFWITYSRIIHEHIVYSLHKYDTHLSNSQYYHIMARSSLLRKVCNDRYRSVLRKKNHLPVWCNTI